MDEMENREIIVKEAYAKMAQLCRRSEELANAIAATRTNGVVGSKGRKIPRTPSASAVRPTRISAMRLA